MKMKSPEISKELDNEWKEPKTDLEKQTEEALEWWRDISDSYTEDLILKYDMRKPIKEKAILLVWIAEGHQSKPTKN